MNWDSLQRMLNGVGTFTLGGMVFGTFCYLAAKSPADYKDVLIATVFTLTGYFFGKASGGKPT